MKHPDFDLIVFDYDGVVADSEMLNNLVLADLLNGIGLPTSLDYSLTHYLGRRWADISEQVSGRLGSPCPPELQRDWFIHCGQRYQTELRPVNGFAPFLAGRTEKRCIASSSPPDWIAMGLDLFGSADAFDGCIFSGAVHVQRGKPHPDIFLYAAEAMQVAPDRALVIEDSPAGVMGGVAAGMTVVGLCAGGHIRDGHADSLKAAGAHHIFDSYEQLNDWLNA